MKIAFKSLTTLLIIFSVSTASFAQKNKKSKQDEKNAKFVAIKKLVESRDFVFTAERAFPSGGQPIELISNPGQLVVRKDMAYAGLPYVGQSHTAMYGSQEVGMEFKGEMKDVKMRVNEKKRKIYFSFRVVDNDSYNISMEITYNASCSVSIISQKKTSISYSGSIAKYEE